MTERNFRSRVEVARRTNGAAAFVDAPHVVWRRRGCRCRLLSVWLRPTGWELIGEDFRERPADWIDRTNYGNELLDDHFAGAAYMPNLRQVKGVNQTLDLDLSCWPTARFQVGCDDAVDWVDVSAVIEDSEKFKATRRRVVRDL